MTLAIVLIIAAVLSLVVILWAGVTRRLQLSPRASSADFVEPLDVEAFRNLTDPEEDAYLRQRLPAAEFRQVRRARLRAMAAYIQSANHNAAILLVVGQAAQTSADANTAEAARQLANQAAQLRWYALVALLRIKVALAWPYAPPAAGPLLHGYQQLSSAAMLLGRLQNPAVPVRISALR